jgi:hypothetical protein
MTQYLLSVHSVDGTPMPSDEEMQAAFAAVDAFNTEVQAAGAWVFAGGLLPPQSATVVDATGGQVVTTDGPFAETKEVLGGFYVVDVADLDEALGYAAMIPGAKSGSIEVRPIVDFDAIRAEAAVAGSVASD